MSIKITGRMVWSNVRSVTIYNATVNGAEKKNIDVDVPRRDAELALRVAQAVCKRLQKFGFFLLDAVVSQYNHAAQHAKDRWKRAGSHDLVADRPHVQGKSSIEVKLRTIEKADRAPTVRRQLQNLAHKLWPSATAKSKHGWGERVVLLVEFTGAMDEEWDAMRCDSLLVGLDNKPENWDPLFGWEGSLPPAKGASKALPAQCALPARTLNRTPPAELDPPPATPLERQRKRKFETLYRGVHKCTLYGSEMGAVKDMIVAMCDEGVPAAKRTRNTVGEKITGWSQRWSWPAHSWTKTPKFSSKGGGGKWGLAATKNALNDSHRHLSV